MEVRVFPLLEGAEYANGTVVIIDVLRAFSTAAYVFAQGAREMIVVEHLQEAFALKETHPDFVLMGEEFGLQVPGFDYGNSPTQILGQNFSGKTIIFRTTAGTPGIRHAFHAKEILAAGFLTADAVVKYLMEKNPETVSLVPMGKLGIEERVEDDLCAEYIAWRLAGKKPDFENMKRRILAGPGAQIFLDKGMPEFPESDLDLCLQAGKFDFVLRADKKRERLFRVDV
ncbi:MAG: 2-phosphosulfolactate phosphatase [Candidatus Diapherotrites archaeon]|nr:2-phosphosulfolactate phosphatase [Candidatus Diapherotrites archaeon]